MVVRLASARLPGETPAEQEETQYRVTAAVVEMTPYCLLTAAFLSMMEAKMAYSSASTPAYLEVPAWNGERVRYTWLNIEQVLPWHHRVMTGDAKVYEHREPTPQEAEQGVAPVLTIRTMKEMWYPQQTSAPTSTQDGTPVAEQPQVSLVKSSHPPASARPRQTSARPRQTSARPLPTSAAANTQDGTPVAEQPQVSLVKGSRLQASARPLQTSASNNTQEGIPAKWPSVSPKPLENPPRGEPGQTQPP